MNDSKISVRYAKAIFNYAKDKDVLTEVYKDFGVIKAFFSYSSELMEIISSPIVKTEEKLLIVNKVFSQLIGETSLYCLSFVIKKGREEFILPISFDYEELYRKDKNIKEVIITTGTEIKSSFADKISQVVKDTYKSNVEIRNIVDASMIGGIKLRIDNNILDLSVKTQIDQIRKILKIED